MRKFLITSKNGFELGLGESLCALIIEADSCESARAIALNWFNVYDAECLDITNAEITAVYNKIGS